MPLHRTAERAGLRCVLVVLLLVVPQALQITSRKATRPKEHAGATRPPAPPPQPPAPPPPPTMPTDLAANYDYCIVGAGPGGLQLGQFMLEKGRDYKIFERQMRPGSFFARFPTHRELISINKRNTGRTNPEFNRRHDWNSLVGHDEVPTIPSESLRPLASSVSGALRLANAHHVGLTPRDLVRPDSKTLSACRHDGGVSAGFCQGSGGGRAHSVRDQRQPH